MTEAKRAKNVYYWRELEVGESHYRHRMDLDQAVRSWANFRQNNPDMRDRTVVFTQSQNGVKWERTK